jgi:energy-coupling factor transporter transmembrane protein EcfT
MDELAYSSRMVNWAPLGKLLFVMCLLVVGLLTDSILVPIITFTIGIIMMAYSTNLKLPLLILVAIGEAILIMVLGSGMISILGDHSQPALWEDTFLWFNIYMTEQSFNTAWLIFFRAIAGVTLMLAFASSTPIPLLSFALKSLRIPNEIIELIVLIYRYAFLLLERFLVMIDAAQCRLGYNGSLTAMKSYAGAMAGTFIFSMELAEKSEAALACRNYNGTFPIFREPAKMSIIWVIISFGLAVGLYFLGQYTGDLVNFAKIFAPLFGWDI